MKLNTLQENLTKGLSITSRAVASRSTLPVLSNILLSTDDDRLKLSATNLEIGINCWIGARVEQPGAITLPARTLADLVKTLPSDHVNLELTERTQTIHLRCGRSEANIKGIDAQDFPQLPIPDDSEQIVIQSDVLKTMINRVAFAAATDESRLMLTGVLTQFDGDQLIMSAADGFRVSVASTTIAPVSSSIQVLIPAKALAVLAAILPDGEVGISMLDNKVVFSTDDIELIAQAIDLQFPDVDQIIPKQSNIEVTINRSDLLRAIRAASVFSRDAAMMVKLTVGENVLTVSGRSDETGAHEMQIDATANGDGLVIAFNARYLQDWVGSVGSEMVKIELTTGNNPGLLTGDDGYTHVIMPMQIGQ